MVMAPHYMTVGKNEKTLVTMERSRQAAYIIMSLVTWGPHGRGAPSLGSYFIVTPLPILSPGLEISGHPDRGMLPV